ncbi:MAG: metal ABC transporter permease [Alphaproteobacteria bacterium]
MLADFWAALTLSGGYNAAVVMLGLGALGAAAGPVGAFMILKRRPLLADAVAHATLPGVAAGFLLALALTGDGRQPVFLLAGAALAGAGAAGAMHWLKDGARIGEDAATAAALSVAFGIGVALLSLIQALPTGGQAGLNAYLLGQAATMTGAEAWTVALVGAGALLLLIVFFKELTAAAFDPIQAVAQGFPVRGLDLMTTGLMLVLVAAGLRAVGLVLILALLVTPAAAARFWTDRLPKLAVLAALFGGGGAYVGGALSAAAPGLPTGALIVAILSSIFVFSLAFAPRRGALAAAWRRFKLVRALARRDILKAIILGTPVKSGRARRLGWFTEAGIATEAGHAAASRWAIEERLRDRYLDDHPAEAGRLGANLRPLAEILPRDVIADLERRSP